MTVLTSYLGLTLICLFFISFILIGIYKTIALKFGLVSNSLVNEEHTSHKPIGAGIVFMLIWLAYVCYAYFNQHMFDQHIFFILVMPVVLIAIVSFCDDLFTIKPRWRFLAQFIAAITVIILLNGIPYLDFGLFHSHILWINIILALLALIWSTNLFNFMDGIDGLAALQACFMFTAGGILLYLHGDYPLSLQALVLAATVFGFLLWNWPIAKIFMGDVGSTCLGFLFIVFCLIAQTKGISILLWFMLYEIFVIDTTLTLIRRVLRKESVHEGHTTFAFHRLHQTGWSNRKILYGIISLDLIIAGLTFTAFIFPSTMFALIVVETALLLAVYLWIERRKPMFG